MASCTCHVLCGTKRLRLERIVRPRTGEPRIELLAWRFAWPKLRLTLAEEPDELRML
jgi:hypothetical protein